MAVQRWRSGRTRTTRNRVTWEHVRGFESLSLRHIPPRGFCLSAGYFCAENEEFEGRQAGSACAGRRILPTTKQRTPAVFRARPLKARIPLSAPQMDTLRGTFLRGAERIEETPRFGLRRKPSPAVGFPLAGYGSISRCAKRV